MHPTLSASGPASPIVKWAGGKRQLLPHLLRSQPPVWRHYLEPFAGGAALFFALNQPHSYVSDTNSDLIQVYQTVRDHVDALIASLIPIQRDYDALPPSDRAAFFYALRDRYNRRQDSALVHSAVFLALGRLAFNGLYRVNAHGTYNTPFGHYSHPDIVRAQTLRCAQNLLQSATIVAVDYQAAVEIAQPFDFVYCDPPYTPVSPTAHFTHYTATGFSWADHVALAAWVHCMADRGVSVMVSHANLPAIYDLYHGLWCQVVPTRRAINADATQRTGMSEVILTTYPVPGAQQLPLS